MTAGGGLLIAGVMSKRGFGHFRDRSLGTIHRLDESEPLVGDDPTRRGRPRSSGTTRNLTQRVKIPNTRN
jgi:hypothetical protein